MRKGVFRLRNLITGYITWYTFFQKLGRIDFVDLFLTYFQDRIPMTNLAVNLGKEGISAFRFDFAGNG